MNIPNFLTLIRFVLIPVFIFTFFKYDNYFIPFSIFILAGITDMLDGYIARKTNMITEWGKLLDPLADKGMQLSALFVLTYATLIPIWITIIVLAKELFLIIGSGILYKNNVVAQASWYGKIATVLFYTSIITIVFIHKLIGNYLLIIAVAATVYSAIRYTIYYLTAPNRSY